MHGAINHAAFFFPRSRRHNHRGAGVVERLQRTRRRLLLQGVLQGKSHSGTDNQLVYGEYRRLLLLRLPKRLVCGTRATLHRRRGGMHSHQAAHQHRGLRVRLCLHGRRDIRRSVPCRVHLRRHRPHGPRLPSMLLPPCAAAAGPRSQLGVRHGCVRGLSGWPRRAMVCGWEPQWRCGWAMPRGMGSVPPPQLPS